MPVTVLAILQFIGGGVWLLVGAIVLGASALGSEDFGLPEQMAGVLAAVGGALALACGIGLWTLKRYGRTLQLILAFIGLLGFPLGTIMSVVILVYMFKPGVKALFSERAPADMTEEEEYAVRALQSSSSAVTIVLIVTVVLGAVVVFGIVAAVAIPGLLSARMSGNEASAIGTLRAINSGQFTYAAVCGQGGYAESLADLAKPQAGGASGFIAPHLSVDGVEVSGYLVRLMPGPSAQPVATIAETCNGTGSISGYFAVAVPRAVGETGQRSFATDARGTIYAHPGGANIGPEMDGAAPLQ